MTFWELINNKFQDWLELLHYLVTSGHYPLRSKLEIQQQTPTNVMTELKIEHPKWWICFIIEIFIYYPLCKHKVPSKLSILHKKLFALFYGKNLPFLSSPNAIKNNIEHLIFNINWTIVFCCTFHLQNCEIWKTWERKKNRKNKKLWIILWFMFRILFSASFLCNNEQHDTSILCRLSILISWKFSVYYHWIKFVKLRNWKSFCSFVTWGAKDQE